MTMRHGDEEETTLASTASDAGPAATPRAEPEATPLEQAIERTSRHASTPAQPRNMSAIDRQRAARIAWAAWREAHDIMGNGYLPSWFKLDPSHQQQCCDLIEQMAQIPFGMARSRQHEIFQAIAYAVGE